ncbi:right-handed parallel beta-helix repeat-containing protein [Puniceicoccales bacterium CK1056]|uniref:Right-handed parallel beta-helix repeat-containing protein n=1 Tax=Oceanipulchritudo coccoides TaxID=2706888 RepID=A0A6B2LZ14_9BACT|nr:right-handed parallel beta-helix repeat-containing protein [Oceanipulchritudo coccoides]NDV61673.1 right-handed parallel beta-helix repeat-containing protein [Oceanipulchritudo coccoides]
MGFLFLAGPLDAGKDAVSTVCSSLSVAGQSYYIDSRKGSDANSGTAPHEAWATLSKVNSMGFQPGDRILFRSGSEWNGRLVPKGSGTAEEPIVIDRYGEGKLPAIHGLGKWESAVLLENIEYWEVRNLEITNKGPRRKPGRRGLVVRALNMGDCRGIHLKGLVIRDVNGSLVKRDGAGSAILIHNGGKQVPTRFIDLLIEDCHLYRCERNGINFRGNSRRSEWHPSLKVVIRNNLLEQIPGDGIVPIGCDGALVEYNVMRDCPDTLPFGDAAAGIWPWSSDNTLIQFNEVSDHNAKWDGQGFDADYNCIGTVIQYNYSHDNAGGFLLICNKGDSLGGDINVGTEDTVVRYNLSINDGIREYPTKRQGWFSPAIHISGPCKNTRIHNNLIIIPEKRMPEIDSTVVHFHNWGGSWPVDTHFEKNIFISPNSRGFQSGGDKRTVYSQNCYIGNFDSLPDDPTGVLDASSAPGETAWGDDFQVLKAFLQTKQLPKLDESIPVPPLFRELFGE